MAHLARRKGTAGLPQGQAGRIAELRWRNLVTNFRGVLDIDEIEVFENGPAFNAFFLHLLALFNPSQETQVAYRDESKNNRLAMESQSPAQQQQPASAQEPVPQRHEEEDKDKTGEKGKGEGKEENPEFGEVDWFLAAAAFQMHTDKSCYLRRKSPYSSITLHKAAFSYFD